MTGTVGYPRGMRVLVPSFVALALLVVATRADARPRKRAPRCTIDVTNPAGTLAINRAALPDFAPATLRTVLGEPDRIEQVTSKQRYEEYSPGGKTSDLVDVTDAYYVYDRLGLVFASRGGADPDRVIVFFAHARTFDHTALPQVTPSKRGDGRVRINGVAVKPDADARPRGVDYRTPDFPRFGARFGSTSFSTVIDRIYTLDGARHVDLFLDGPETGRPAYVEIR